MATTKLDIANAIAQKTGVEQQRVREIVQTTLDGIVDVLATEKRIELRNFGIFEVHARNARRGRNPRTGATVAVPAQNVVRFKAGKIMDDKILASSSLSLPKSATT